MTNPLTGEPLGCDFNEPFFGARYPDACCCEGYLWDLDSDDDGELTVGGEVPCPQCNTIEHIEWGIGRVWSDGYFAGKKRSPIEIRFGYKYPAWQRAWLHGWVEAEAEV